MSVRQPDPRREAGVYVKPELTRTHVCQYLSRVCSGRGFGRPPPVGRAGAPAASVEPCPSGRSGLYQSWFDIERPASWQEMTETRHRPCGFPGDRKLAIMPIRKNAGRAHLRRVVDRFDSWISVISRHEQRLLCPSCPSCPSCARRLFPVGDGLTGKSRPNWHGSHLMYRRPAFFGPLCAR